MQTNQILGDYAFLNKIGEGSFGQVYKVRKLQNNKFYAIKCLAKEPFKNDESLKILFNTEMKVMSEINHPNIMHLYEYIQCGSNHYLVLQYCNNGDLDSYVKKKHHLQEEEAVYFLRQIMNGFIVLNKKKIMHRDVKLKNMFLNDDILIIGDFGFAKKGQDIATSILGTLYTMAPELLKEETMWYTNKTDLWSIGVCFYQMLYGTLPFQDLTNFKNLQEIKDKSGNNMKFPEEIKISQQSKDLLKALLQADPNIRITWTQFFKNKLFHKKMNFDHSDIKTKIDKINEDKVIQQFNINIQMNLEDTILDPSQHTSKNQQSVKRRYLLKMNGKQQEIIQKGEEKERRLQRIQRIQQRYIHEKQLVTFIKLTASKLRIIQNKNVQIEEISDLLMFSACLLCFKGYLIIEQEYQSLKKDENIFHMDNFTDFLKTQNKKNILDFLKEEYGNYVRFYNDMVEKFNSDVINQNYQNISKQCQEFKMQKIDCINYQLWEIYDQISNQIQIQNQDLKQQVLQSLQHLKFCILNKDFFPFILNNGKIFNWDQFQWEQSRMKY